MKTLVNLAGAIIIALDLVILAACNSPAPLPAVQASTVAPGTATAAPPTDTPVPPTDTSVPPTDIPTATATAANTTTPTATATSRPTGTNTVTKTLTRTPTRKPPTATPAPLTLQGALQRTMNRNHRFDMSEYFSDPFQEIEMLNARGETTVQAVHMYVGGELIKSLGYSESIETIVTKDQLYLRLPLPGTNEAKWYYSSRSKSNAKGVASVSADELLEPSVTRYDKIGSETVDGLSCDVYSIDKEAARKALAASGVMTQQQLDNMVNIELTYWWCSDGYVHRARVRTDFKYPLDPSTTMIARIESHYYDFGAPIEVSLPADAAFLP